MSDPVEEIVCQFRVTAGSLQQIANHFVGQLKRGLLDPRLPFQLPAFVTTVPDGSETGRYLSVDLGGTNCRICLVDLLGHGAFAVVQAKHPVPRALMVQPRHEPLFDWVAARIQEFGQDQGLFGVRGPSLPLGFTFSFTCDQTSLAAGTLLHWDKGWDIPSAVGCNPCRLLQLALDAASVPVRVVVLANDSVGTLLARAYTAAGRGRTLAGLIVGTGTNAAYVERLVHVRRHRPDTTPAAAAPDDLMIVNTEWGCLDDGLCVLPQTRFDDALDEQSTDPGAQMLEKRVAGMYLGELFRLAVVELAERHLLDGAVAADAPLFRPGAVDSSLLSLLAGAPRQAQAVAVAAVGFPDILPQDLVALQRVSTAVTTRAARLVGAALAAIVVQSGWLAVTSSPSSLSHSLHGYNGKSAVAECLPESPLKSPPKRPVDNASLNCLARFFSCWRRRKAVCGVGSVSPPPPDLIDIGITGSVIELHPTFEAEMRLALCEIDGVGPAGEKRIRTSVCADGSAVGAALMAQVACREARECV